MSLPYETWVCRCQEHISFYDSMILTPESGDGQRSRRLWSLTKKQSSADANGLYQMWLSNMSVSPWNQNCVCANFLEGTRMFMKQLEAVWEYAAYILKAQNADHRKTSLLVTLIQFSWLRGGASYPEASFLSPLLRVTWALLHWSRNHSVQGMELWIY